MELNYYPKISIVTPVFNQARYLEQTILSVISQNYPNLEYVIIDGGSTDGTVEIIKKYAPQLSYWVSEPDNGMYDAIEKGFSKCTGEIMAWINSDDMYHRNSLFTVAEIFLTFPNVNWITGASTTYDKRGQTLSVGKSRPFTKYDILCGDYMWIQQESTTWRREIWDEYLRLKNGRMSNYKYAGDFFLWSRFFQIDHLYVTSALIGGFRIRGGQLTNCHLADYISEAESIIDTFPITEKDAQIINHYKYLKRICRRLKKIKIIDSTRILKRYRRKYFDEVPLIEYNYSNDKFSFENNPHHPYF